MKKFLILLGLCAGFSACDGESIPWPDQEQIDQKEVYDDDQYKERKL